MLMNLGAHLENNCVIVSARQQHLVGTDSLPWSFFTIALSEPWSLRDTVKRTYVFITEQAVSALGLVQKNWIGGMIPKALPSGWCVTPPGLSPRSLSPCSIASHSLTVSSSVHFIHSLPAPSIHGGLTEHLP